MSRNRKVPTVIVSQNEFTSQLIPNDFFVDLSEDLHYLFDDTDIIDDNFSHPDKSTFFLNGLIAAASLISVPAFLQRRNVLVIPEFTTESLYRTYNVDGQDFYHGDATLVGILPAVLAKVINYHVNFTICVPTNYRDVVAQRIIDYYSIPTVEMSRQYRLGDEDVTFTIDNPNYDLIQLTGIHNYSNGVFNINDLKNDFVQFTNGDFHLVDFYLGDKERIVGDEINDKYKLLSNLKTVVETEDMTRKSNVYQRFDKLHNNVMRVY